MHVVWKDHGWLFEARTSLISREAWINFQKIVFCNCLWIQKYEDWIFIETLKVDSNYYNKSNIIRCQYLMITGSNNATFINYGFTTQYFRLFSIFWWISWWKSMLSIFSSKKKKTSNDKTKQGQIANWLNYIAEVMVCVAPQANIKKTKAHQVNFSFSSA